MGTGTGIACKNCDYSKDFTIGVGMMYSVPGLTEGENPLIAHLIKSKKTISRIMMLLEEKNATIPSTYGHDIYNCEKCGEFYNRFFIHLDYKGGSFEPEYTCSKCRKSLKMISYNIVEDSDSWPIKEMKLDEYPCPKCSKFNLYKHFWNNMMWH